MISSNLILIHKLIQHQQNNTYVKEFRWMQIALAALINAVSLPSKTLQTGSNFILSFGLFHE